MYLISILVQPMTDQQLEAMGWQNVFLNYFLTFSSNPPVTYSSDLSARDSQREMNAIAALLVLGEDFGLAGDKDYSTQPGQNSAGGVRAAGTQEFDTGGFLARQAFRYLATMASRFISKGTVGLATRFVDYFRFSPRFDYVNREDEPQGGGGTAVASAGSSAVRFKDVTMEVGKSITDQLYMSAAGLYFNRDALEEDAKMAAGTTQGLVQAPNYGARLGLEYSLGLNRQLVGYVNYNVDDRLEARTWRQGEDRREPSFYLGVRGSIRHDNYTRHTARRRAAAARGL